MKIENLTTQSTIYTSNVYLVRGDWNQLSDINTLVDVGRDETVMERIESSRTGVGKKRVEQVVLTHTHYDHVSMLGPIKKIYAPPVYGYSRHYHGIDRTVDDGDILTMGDSEFEVIHCPGHSHDSICLYNQTEGVLFSGDAPLVITTPDGSHERTFIHVLERLCDLDIRTIYFGHGPPRTKNCNQLLGSSLRNAKA
ncbi:MBL fold metallo-hydrolase [Desulfoplanes sp.]